MLAGSAADATAADATAPDATLVDATLGDVTLAGATCIEVNIEDKLCIICMAEPRAVRFAPCGHANSCEECCLKLIQHSLRKRLQPSFTAVSSSADLVTIDEYLEAELASSDSARAALAQRAKEHWTEALNPSELPWPTALSGAAGLMLPLRPWPVARWMTVVLALALMGAYVWGCVAVFLASDDFEEYLRKHKFDLKVTQVEGFAGPVTALIIHGQRCGLKFTPCLQVLPDPTAHQRWWGLVPENVVGQVTSGVDVLRQTRKGLFYLTLIMGLSAVAQPLISACRNKPQMVGELSNAGIHAMAGMALMASLYGMFWDREHNLVIINYVPGAGYAWFIIWMLIVCLLLVTAFLKRSWTALLGFVTATLYWLFWLMIPLLGYTWFFAWKFVDTAYSYAILDQHHRLEHMPFSADAAARLGPPFALCAYLGFTCWAGALVVSILSYMRHLTLLQTDDQYRQAVFLDAMRARSGAPQGQQVITLMAVREIQREIQRQSERRAAAAAVSRGGVYERLGTPNDAPSGGGHSELV
ncbi:hypothetical protein Ctob_000733 [Chrysochromulina tobinii]|uniref:Uncharacterized protein n=1 Tax=Chrysochromulina tobinii TaxID=1460289 RepID=A0A0M0J7Y7_9EUKA|nr:hypothetical protein Ctob_000733 [Chrysochromulina tobinii]|eukprot:KOO22338.1 hypothetical protein Ctob_000733 [Chrysochromulina sp. CCMP291]